MKKRYALKLHNGDEVIVKKTGCHLYVIKAFPSETEKNGKIVVNCVHILLSDGNWYRHKQVA